ncbi:MAG: ABC transporter substrate-binding protein [Deltaproteobacteria bacterium]|nr:ABC transporter substrate-binding protein [Deltaproteobacteria bacterium]
MKKLSLILTAIFFALFALSSSGWCWGKKKIIKIGVNAPITGDIPKVGENSKNTAKMWLEDIEKAGGIEIAGKKYPVELIVEDNEAQAESAVKTNTKMITEDEVIIIIGPQSSKQAIPAGGVAESYATPMISPWSTNPDTTKDRPYVFRGCFLDPFQGPMLANFAKNEFKLTKAAVLYDVASDYPKGLAEYFKQAWEKNNGEGSVVSYESFTTKDADFSSQLTKIINSGAEVLFVPQYYNEVALIVKQARELGWKKPILGSDSWGSSETITLCGSDCYGAFFSTHYAAAGAEGITKEFIDRYKEKYGYVPDDVCALTWDSLKLAQKAIESLTEFSGDIKKDRKNVKNNLAEIKNFEGVTGNMSFTPDGDPVKCAVIVKISDKGEFKFYKSVCP